jgi:hypothetical protein
MHGVVEKVDVTFSETKVAYTLTVYLVEKLTVQQLVDKIRKKGFISKESTLNKSNLHWKAANGSEGCGTGFGYCSWSGNIDFEGSDFND